MSMLSVIKAYIKTNPNIESSVPVWVDFMGSEPDQISIIPIPGSRVIEDYINGDSMRAFPFAIQSVESTADELERLQNSGFYEELSEWFETQTFSGVLPTLEDDKVAESIETMGWAYLFAQGESQTGVYQIQCRLVYFQPRLGD